MVVIAGKMNTRQWELVKEILLMNAVTAAVRLINVLDGCGRTTSATSRRTLLMSRLGALHQMPIVSSADCPMAGLNWKLMPVVCFLVTRAWKKANPSAAMATATVSLVFAWAGLKEMLRLNNLQKLQKLNNLWK
jgi:hypothetical protein